MLRLRSVFLDGGTKSLLTLDFAPHILLCAFLLIVCQSKGGAAESVVDPYEVAVGVKEQVYAREEFHLIVAAGID